MSANREEGNHVEHVQGSEHETVFAAKETEEPRYVHPQAKKLFDVVPCVRYIPVAGTSIEAFGPSCTLSLAAVYLLSKGVGKNLLSYSIYPMFDARYQVNASVRQRMSAISNLGFSIKPAAAILSDAFAFLGYTKRWYMAASCLVGLVCSIAYGILPAKESSAQIAAAMIFLAMFSIANIDVLSEGHYSRIIKKYPRPGAHLISWIWAFIMLGTIIAAGIQGPLSDAGHPQIGIFICAGTVGACVFFFIFNLYGEERNQTDRQNDFEMEQRILQSSREPLSEGKQPPIGVMLQSDSSTPSEGLGVQPIGTGAGPGDHADLDRSTTTCTKVGESLWTPPETCCCKVFEVNGEVIKSNLTITFYGMLLTVCVIGLAIVTIAGGTYDLLYSCVVVSVVLSVTGFFCIPVTVMKANLFGWIQLCSYILIPGALDSFFMADEACLPDGPHFSQTFYQTVGAVIGNVAGLGAVYAFALIFSKHSYRLTCMVTTTVQIVASVFDLIIVKRWNRPHMPDHAMYILGDAIVYQVCYMLNYMPLNILISRLCPKGCESTMFAILASFSNLGASTSSAIGAILMETVWPVDVRSRPCDFSNVPWLIITGHLLTPLICLPLVFLLLPGDRICDELDPKLIEAVPIAQRWIDKLRSRKSAESKPSDEEMPNTA